ncbi:MAG: Gfo/Idh/MocA family oxidoreductase [Aliifodinibius sp.]|nr:Gfo/Idh/MocA family oxidoreductase [Fodinibius sp.]NIV14831.1 Gfo/Idh/MocA family oxidoreductase [Fodinibius sp.]NIY28710.1 Gfo/Idh/MocA family oxidoreductase [Fodinibius sp.]
MQKGLNVAVVGCGYWGPNLIRNFRSLSECQVKQVCDLDQKRLEHMKQLYPEVETTTNFEHLVNDQELDALTIATPVHLHYKLAKKSLLGGKHTFIEKPMASSVAQCLELIELAEKRRLTLMIGHTFIYSPAVRTIKEIVDSGYLGEVFYISAQRLNLGLFQKDINVAWDLAPHDISIILYVLNQSPTFVNCQGKAHVSPGIEDMINLSLDFSNGGFATIHSSWLDPNKIRKMTIVGSKRMILYDDTEPLEKIKIYDKRVEIPPHYDTFAEFHYAYHYGDMRAPYLKQVEPLKMQCQHFLDCIKTGAKPNSSGLEGLRVVQILESASESLKKGGAKVKIES